MCSTLQGSSFDGIFQAWPPAWEWNQRGTYYGVMWFIAVGFSIAAQNVTLGFVLCKLKSNGQHQTVVNFVQLTRQFLQPRNHRIELHSVLNLDLVRACVKATEQLNVKLAGFKEKITQVTQAIENKMTTGWFLQKNGIDL